MAEGFVRLLDDLFDLAVLDALPTSVCGLWPDLSIGYVNPAWIAFGRANRGAEHEDRWGLGVNVLAVTPVPLRPFYVKLFAQAVDSSAPVAHDYECSSAERQRTFRMRVLPTPAGAFVVVHSLLCEQAQTEEAHDAVEELYRNPNGMIEQCSHCRRIRRASTPPGPTAAWDWVPDYVARMPAHTSHGLCAVCLDYFYGPESQRSQR